MASSPNATRTSPYQQPHSPAYCSDPNCAICKQLEEVQEAIRLRQPLPRKAS